MHMQTVSLNGTWALRPGDIAWEGEEGYRKMKQAHDGWIEARVPGEVHLDLMRAGQMEEPLVSTNAPGCRWPETKSWWYRTTFEVPAEFLKHERQQLLFEGLDLYAEVFLNGTLVGSAANAFVPAIFEVKAFLEEGENELVVRLTVGSELAKDTSAPGAPEGDQPNPAIGGEIPNPASEGDLYGHRTWPGRKWLRKPQFTYGWDWVDALPNIGIWRGVRLEGRSHVVLHDLRLTTVVRDRQPRLKAEAVLDNLHPWSKRACALELRIAPPTGNPIIRRLDVDAQVGRSPVRFSIEIPDAQLWWPNGMGDQPLYHVTARVLDEDLECDRREFDIGLRTVQIERSRLPEGSRFCIKVNGEEVFCKGANWYPADAILARVTKRKYEALIAEAKNANMNMLRVWGGGIFEDQAFYDACDRAGILVWQDFQFACSPYPDHDPEFRAAVRAEAEAAVMALRHHPSIALWCGGNENIWAFANWWNNDESGSLELGGSVIYNQILPDVCRTLDPERPYWPSSPLGGEEPNDEAAGDCHWWGPFTMNPDVNRRIRHELFDECKSRFVSEYGVIGPCHLDSIREYLKPDELRMDHRAWKVHTNTFEKETIAAAIRLHYADPEALDIPDYILYGQMFQATVYGRSIEALRFRKHDPRDDCEGALIWAYSDCWGETGWSIIDYYLRRKPSYYWFRRACAPVKVIVRRRNDSLVTRVVNDTLQGRDASIRYGWFRTDGSDARTASANIAIPANGMVEVARDAIPPECELDPRKWLYAAVLRGEGIGDDQSVWPLVPHRELALAEPEISVTVKDGVLELLSPVYCHGVHVDDRGQAILSDNYFDLLPGVPVRIKPVDPKAARTLRFQAVMPKSST